MGGTYNFHLKNILDKFMKKHDYDKILYRLLRIWGRLREGEILAKKGLAEEFNVSERTIQKDFNVRLMEILPIKRVKKGYKVKDGYSLDKNINFENELILNILESVSSSMGIKFAKMSKQILSKLQNPHEDFILSKMQIEDLSKHIKEVKLIQNSIINHQEIKFFYKKDRIAKPYKIAIFEGFWYLYAEDKGDSRFKTFYIKDISKLQITNKTFKIDIDMLKKLDSAINIWFEPNQQLFEVVLLADKNIAKYFKRRELSVNQKILEEFEDGSIKFSIYTTSKRAILHEIKKWIPELLVLSPQNLAKDMIQIAKEYEKKQTFLIS